MENQLISITENKLIFVMRKFNKIEILFKSLYSPFLFLFFCLISFHFLNIFITRVIGKKSFCFVHILDENNQFFTSLLQEFFEKIFEKIFEIYNFQIQISLWIV